MNLFTRTVKTFKASALSMSTKRHDNVSFQLVYGPENDGQHTEFVDKIKALVENREYEKVVSEIKKLEKEPLFAANGDPLFVRISQELYDKFDSLEISPAECEELLPSYKAWHDSSPDCPFATATYAYVLGATGFVYRGPDFANKVKKEGWEKLKEFSKRGQSVFDKNKVKHKDHWYWRHCRHNYSIIDGPEFEEIYRRFELCEEKMPFTPSLYTYIVFLLLPRWYGNFEAIEKFAQDSASKAPDSYEDALYAKIYAKVLSSGEEHDDLHWDRERFSKGIRDWLKFFPNEFFQTQIAAEAFLMVDYNLCLDMLEGLEHLYFEAFECGESPQFVNSACREFTGR